MKNISETAECPECGTYADHIPHGQECRIKDALAEADRRIAQLTKERDDVLEQLLAQVLAPDVEAELAEAHKLIDDLANALDQSQLIVAESHRHGASVLHGMIKRVLQRVADYRTHDTLDDDTNNRVIANNGIESLQTAGSVDKTPRYPQLGGDNE